MSNFRDKKIAYIDRSNDDEIIEVEAVDVLPRRGQPVNIGQGKWQVFDVTPVRDQEFDALVLVDRRD